MVYTNEPIVAVGIVSGKLLSFTLTNAFMVNSKTILGNYSAHFVSGKIFWEGCEYAELLFTPIDDSASFTLQDVVIGVKFHWQRKESQTFRGSLRIIVDGERLYAINEIKVEDYLTSVISSEMSATSSLELLKAHAVISRSWLLSQIENRKRANIAHQHHDFIETPQKIIRWYDRTDHTLFDVCADDHCQRYQGIGRMTSSYVKQAVAATRGEVLTYDNKICDARFSKCCGGVSESFEYCWDNIKYPYLKAVADIKPKASKALPDLTDEETAKKWIKTSPNAFCNTDDKEVLRQVLNDYDQETSDFYRWTVKYTQTEVSTLLEHKLGIGFGNILALNPLKRGDSGRIYELEIVGSQRTMVIGKELEIRRALSESHLYSSAFVVETTEVVNDVPQLFKLIGAGWGHGVGLCQIGAAVMGANGYDYQTILAHYYVGSALTQLY